MAIATVVPVAWGISVGLPEAGEWIALTADCICWVALKGTFAQRLRILLGGAMLTLAATLLGSATGGSAVWSVGCMLGVAFLAGLFKNLGERGSGLSLCLYVMFLIANAHPASGTDLKERMLLTLIGGAWNTLLGLTTALAVREQQPYRRTISGIWRASAGLMAKIAAGWDGRAARANQRELYVAEKEVRAAIDVSFAFHERAAHQLRGKEGKGAEYQLAQVRKSAALVATHMTAIAEELEGIRLQSVEEALRIRLAKLFRALRISSERMSVLVLTRRPEETLLMRDAVDSIRIALTALEEHRTPTSLGITQAVRRVIQLATRCGRLMERSMQRLEGVAESPMFRAYPVMKTIYVLHPKHWWRSLRLLFSIDSHTARYAMRTALAAALAVGISRWFHINHGYWLPFTVIIVMQPYFVATIRKAIDRLIGTVAGGIAGGLLLLLPAHLHLKEAMLFCSAILMIHFFKAQYRVSAFFITLNLVVLFSVSQELDKQIILLRAGLTLLGAVIGVTAGFLLLPAWDRKWLPRLLAGALARNWAYFAATFSERTALTWTRFKRVAEVANSNAFDSFNRAVQEPGGLRRDYAAYYQLIMHSVRITRELNNFHLEIDSSRYEETAAPADAADRELVEACAKLFEEALQLAKPFSRKPLRGDETFKIADALPRLNAAQKLYLSRLHNELRLLLQNLRTLLPAPPSPQPSLVHSNA